MRRKLFLFGMTMPIWGRTYEREQGKNMTEQIHDVEVSGDGFTYPMASLAKAFELDYMQGNAVAGSR